MTSHYTEARSVSLRRMKLELESLHRLHMAEARAAETRRELERIRLQTEIELAEASNRFDEERILGEAHWIILQIGWRKLLCGTPSITCPCLWTNAIHRCQASCSTLTCCRANRRCSCHNGEVLTHGDGAWVTKARHPKVQRWDRDGIPAISIVVSACARRLSNHDRRKGISISLLIRPREGDRVIFPFENTDKPFTRVLAALDK